MERVGKIGQGTFGMVYNAKSPGGNQYAVKRNLAEKNSSFISACRELDLLSRCKAHPCVIELSLLYYDPPFELAQMSPLVGEDRRYQRDDNIHFAFPLASGSLADRIYQQEISFSGYKRYMLQLLLGLEFLCQQRILHRDLKPANVLVFKDEVDYDGFRGRAKICDFGISKIHTAQGIQTPGVVTPNYRAPEILADHHYYDYKSDVWSLGCVFFEMIARRMFINVLTEDRSVLMNTLFQSVPEPLGLQARRKFLQGSKLNLGSPTSTVRRRPFVEQLGLNESGKAMFTREIGSLDDFVSLLTGMLAVEPEKRLSVQACLAHPFFRNEANLISIYRRNFSQSFQANHLFETYAGIERKWMVEIAIDLFNRRGNLTWYSDRAFFQAIDLYDRWLIFIRKISKPNPNAIESNLKGFLYTKDQVRLQFYACLYLAVKYFTSVQVATSFDEVTSPHPIPAEAREAIRVFEEQILHYCTEHKLYRTTLYEIADEFGDILSPTAVRNLFILTTLNGSVEGMSLIDIYSFYRPHLEREDQTCQTLRMK